MIRRFFYFPTIIQLFQCFSQFSGKNCNVSVFLNYQTRRLLDQNEVSINFLINFFSLSNKKGRSSACYCRDQKINNCSLQVQPSARRVLNISVGKSSQLKLASQIFKMKVLLSITLVSLGLSLAVAEAAIDKAPLDLLPTKQIGESVPLLTETPCKLKI